MHVNQQVREKAKTRFESAGVVSVFTNRAAQLLDAQLPAAVISTPMDQVEQATKDGRERRLVTMSGVVVLYGDSETVDDDADALRAALEAVMDDDLDGVAKNIQHTGAELDMRDDEEGERWFAFLAMTWEVEVWTQRGDPEVAL